MNTEKHKKALEFLRAAEEALLDCADMCDDVLTDEDIVESDKDAPQDPRPELARLVDSAYTALLELRTFLEGL